MAWACPLSGDKGAWHTLPRELLHPSAITSSHAYVCKSFFLHVLRIVDVPSVQDKMVPHQRFYFIHVKLLEFVPFRQYQQCICIFCRIIWVVAVLNIF